MASAPIKDPPQQSTSDGECRRVGVELEFSGLGAKEAAQLVSDVYDGDAKQLSDHRFEVETPDFGTFIVELDTKYAHPNPNWGSDFGEDSAAVAIDRSVSRMVGDLAEGLVPTEIVTPPLPYTSLGTLTDVVEGLRALKAQGTESSVFSGFGVHLNPEVPTPEAENITRLLKAYLICSPKLRENINVDATRRAMPFIDPFPDDYVRKVLAPDYQPDLGGLIDDYLELNPTRNRELDMLPLFRHLDENRVVAVLDDDRIKARPTYHYRLPDMKLADPDWSVVTEWNRWVSVEELAEDDQALKTAAEDHLEKVKGGLLSSLFGSQDK